MTGNHPGKLMKPKALLLACIALGVLGRSGPASPGRWRRLLEYFGLARASDPQATRSLRLKDFWVLVTILGVLLLRSLLGIERWWVELLFVVAAAMFIGAGFALLAHKLDRRNEDNR